MSVENAEVTNNSNSVSLKSIDIEKVGKFECGKFKEKRDLIK